MRREAGIADDITSQKLNLYELHGAVTACAEQSFMKSLFDKIIRENTSDSELTENLRFPIELNIVR